MTDRDQLPAGLGPSGRALWTSITDVYELDGAEWETLAQACRLTDQAAGLAAVLDGADLMVPGSAGQEVLHPALGELRQTRVAVAALLGKLKLPTEGEQTPVKPSAEKSTSARSAARQRWTRRTGA